jgi:hypothetical protein
LVTAFKRLPQLRLFEMEREVTIQGWQRWLQQENAQYWESVFFD